MTADTMLLIALVLVGLVPGLLVGGIVATWQEWHRG